MTVAEARAWIDFDHEQLSVREQCRLLGFQRSGIYYEPQPETEGNLRIMRLMDEEHLRHPARGSRQIVDFLEDQGLLVNRKRVQRLMRKMGIEGISPKRRATLAAAGCIPTCCGGSKSSVPTRCGAATSRTSQWPAASCTWWRY